MTTLRSYGPDRTPIYALAVARSLSPGEQVMFEGHPSWRAILAFYFKGILMVLVACLIAAGITTVASKDSRTSTVAIVAVVGVALVILAGFIKRVTTHYTITNKRLRIQRGIISRDIQETRLERVQNVNFSQGVFQRMLQVGDVDFDTAGTDDYGFTFAGVANPDDVVQQVDRATAAAAAGPQGLGQPAPAAAPPADQQQQP
jgi:uncharacterized membrane protein YdbT with pleckstrin-like domain